MLEYKIILDINPIKNIFYGKVVIYNLSENILDCVNLEIENIFSNGNKINYNLDNDKLILEKIENIEIYYKGIIGKIPHGLYKSDEETVITHFEPIYARQLFPCLDHPTKKAIFQVILTFPKEYYGLSNTSLQKYEIVKTTNKKILIFEKTPVMSSYLLAIGIGKFDKLSDNIKNIKLNVFVPKGLKQQGSYGLKITKQSLEWFINHFKIDYMINKLDSVVVNNFSSGAMENLGLIVYRDSAFLINENNVINKNRLINLSLTIAHEIAHQWFGNLVTTSGWGDLWLNEAFATLYSHICIDHLYPNWKVWNDYHINNRLITMEYSSISKRPISCNCLHEKQCYQYFDDISYDKGSSILYMIYKYYPKDKIINAITQYLIKYSSSNVSLDTFITYMKLHFNDFEMWRNWFLISEYPTIYIKEGYLYNNTNLIVPIKIGNEHLLLKDKLFVGKHIKINTNGIGFYHCIYDDYNFTELTYLDKINIIGDINLCYKKKMIDKQELKNIIFRYQLIDRRIAFLVSTILFDFVDDLDTQKYLIFNYKNGNNKIKKALIPILSYFKYEPVVKYLNFCYKNYQDLNFKMKNIVLLKYYYKIDPNANQYFIKRYIESKILDEKLYLMKIIKCVEMLELSLSEHVKSQNMAIIFNANKKRYAWDFFIKNHNKIVKKVGKCSNTYNDIITSITENDVSKKEIIDFFNDNECNKDTIKYILNRFNFN